MSVRFRGSNHPARQATDSHRLPAFASIGNPDSVFDNTDQTFLSVVNVAITFFHLQFYQDFLALLFCQRVCIRSLSERSHKKVPGYDGRIT